MKIFDRRNVTQPLSSALLAKTEYHSSVEEEFHATDQFLLHFLLKRIATIKLKNAIFFRLF